MTRPGDESEPGSLAGEEVIDATAHDAGVSVVTQRGAVIGIELLLTDEEYQS